MSFSDKQSGVFITVLNGKFCVRSNADDPNAVSRVNKIGKTVYEVFHDAFTGKLIAIKTKESADYGKSWIFDFLSSDGQTYHLQLSYSNSYATALLKMLPNVDLSKPFKLSPSLKVVDGKNQSSLFVNQDDKPIKHAFTKDMPNGMPNLEKIMVKGKETWDDSKRLAFLEKMVNDKIIPKLDNSSYILSREPAIVGNTFADYSEVVSPLDHDDDPGF